MPALVLAALLQIADVQPARVEHASADDCAIMVLAGKAQLGWGSQASKYKFSAYQYRDDGTPQYVADCPWQALGVVPPENTPDDGKPRAYPPGMLHSESNFYGASGWNSEITRPHYEPAGLLAIATVITAKIAEDGSSPKITFSTCNFYQYGGRWNLSGCKELTAPGKRP